MRDIFNVKANISRNFLLFFYIYFLIITVFKLYIIHIHPFFLLSIKYHSSVFPIHKDNLCAYCFRSTNSPVVWILAPFFIYLFFNKLTNTKKNPKIHHGFYYIHHQQKESWVKAFSFDSIIFFIRTGWNLTKPFKFNYLKKFLLKSQILFFPGLCT